MITDGTKRLEIAEQWSAVRSLCKDSHRQYIVAPGVFVNETPPEEFYNLPFILAYAVLDHGLFVTSKMRPMLGDKLSASRTRLPWVDYSQIEIGKNASNDLRH